MKVLATSFTIAILVACLACPAVAAGPGSCGKGKVWNPDLNKCVNKPRGSGSGW